MAAVMRPRLGRALLFLTLLVGVVAGASSAARSATAPAALERAVGVTLNAGPGGEQQAFEEFLDAGANAIEAAQPWSELEPGRHRYRLGDVAAIVSGVRSEPAMRVMLIPAAIETTRRSVPRDLVRAPWDSQRMIARYRGLLRHLSPHLTRQVRFLSIANEADIYFSAHPRELPAFLRFARTEIAALRRLSPATRVGVTVTYDRLTSAHPYVARKLARLGDATVVTYYPLAGGFRMRPPSAPLHDIPRLVRLAHNRPLVLQEAGYSSAARLGGSPSAQARFVRNVFAAWDRFPRAIPFLSFYSLFDLPASACRAHSDEVAFLCSLGLHRRDGRPKPSWKAFREGVRAIRGTGSGQAEDLSRVDR